MMILPLYETKKRMMILPLRQLLNVLHCTKPKKDDDLTTKGSFDFVHCTKPKKDDDLTTKVTFKFRPLYETKKKMMI